MANQVILSVKGLQKAFGGLMAVSQVDFDIRAGQIKALIGPNGSGKTTTFNLITGHYRPDAGEILFEGEQITVLPPHEIARRGIARTFQNLELFENMTVLENVLIGLYLRAGVSTLGALVRAPSWWRKEKAAQDKALEILERFGLAARAQEPVANLPFGLQRFVEIARALATSPKVLLLDEAASGLDGREKEILCEHILEIRRSGVTIFMVEHDMNMTMNLAEEVVVLDHGQKIAEGTPREIQRHPEVIAVYLG
ncbi:branched-chain amino acid transport system ATP-binding protein [Thermosulfuriphilus ammonigenes]|nr:ABC transporter ATP-binding protein [Thermosulfuriphilus ammonigenes]MBA2848890.1 branched-chain amino acid transport system ATP-binding protein [Thermosulfuriphilus ammonigenes]